MKEKEKEKKGRWVINPEWKKAKWNMVFLDPFEVINVGPPPKITRNKKN